MNPELDALMSYAAQWVQDAAGPAYAIQFSRDMEPLVQRVSAVLSGPGGSPA